MKKHRKQGVYVDGRKRLVDVPVDDELYKADNREDYQRTRSKKHVPLESAVLADFAIDVAEAYEEAQLRECLREALLALTEKERRLIELIYYADITETETAAILKVTRQRVNKKKHEIINKLRNSLIDWIEP